MKLKRCRIKENQQNRLLEFFVAEVTARTAADLAGVNKNTAAYFYHRLREIIAWQLDEASPLAGEIEADESCFKSCLGVPSLKRHSHSLRNKWKFCLGTPLNFRRCLLAWFQKFSIPLMWLSRSAKSSE